MNIPDYILTYEKTNDYPDPDIYSKPSRTSEMEPFEKNS